MDSKACKCSNPSFLPLLMKDGRGNKARQGKAKGIYVCNFELGPPFFFFFFKKKGAPIHLFLSSCKQRREEKRRGQAFSEKKE